MARTTSKGRGWHGDPQGHAKAGRLGGRASSQSRNDDRGSNLTQEDRKRGGQNSRSGGR